MQHPWIKVLVIATAIAMCSLALRELSALVLPVASKVLEVLVPVAIGFAIAYIVLPIVDLFGRVGLKRAVAAGLLFGIGFLAIVATAVLVVPAVVRQGADLTVNLVKGESFVDANANGRYDIGEAFTDGNGNSLRDGPLLGRFAAWAEESQNRLRVSFSLGLNDQALAFLALYHDDTASLRQSLADLVVAGRAGHPASEWPALPPSLPETTAEGGWLAEWPGLLPGEADNAVAFVPEADRTAWWHGVRRIGLALHERHAQWLIAQRRARETTPSTEPKVVQIREAWSNGISGKPKESALAFALGLDAQARSGNGAARSLLTEIGANLESGTGMSDWVNDLEKTIRDGLGDVPSKLGAWAKEGVGGWNWFVEWTINLLLIPIYAFFLLLAMPQIRSFIKDYLPSRHKDQIVGITREIEKAVSAFFRGRLVICIACAITGVLGFLVLKLFGIHVPYGFLFGIGIGLATAIPLAGLLFLLPAIAVTMIQPGAGVGSVVGVIGVYVVVQALEAVLIPTIMGREVELHPVILLIALFLCGKLLGVLGLILAVPIAASVRILAREYFWPRLKGWMETGRWEPYRLSGPETKG